jgi:hypothetical protein
LLSVAAGASSTALPHQCELCDWRLRLPNLAFLAYHIKAKHC